MKGQSQGEPPKTAIIIAVIGLVAALLGLLEKLLSLGLVSRLEQLFELKPSWFWSRGFILACAAVVLLALCAWVWNSRFVPQAWEHFRGRRVLFLRNGILSSIIIIGFVVGVLLLFSQDIVLPKDAEILFPQAARLGPTVIQTYGNNGEVKYTSHKKTPDDGPANGYAQITFKTFGASVNENCGWVIFFMKGVSLARYNQIRFLIRGERGTERIGMKARDAQGRERPLTLEGRYLRQGRITTDWQEAIVPFENFGDVNFKLMSNFSIFVNGEMAGTQPQTIYIGDFRLR